MNYVVVYSDDSGHEFRSDDLLPTIDAVNDEIRALHASVDDLRVLRIEENHDVPRTWNRPEAPADVNRVLGADTEQEWVRREMGPGSRSHWSNGSYSLTWVELLDHERKLTAVVETEVAAAARRLRERRERGDLHTNSPDANIVLNHVLGGGQL